MPKKKHHICGVPQCRNYLGTKGISLHRIPKRILENDDLKKLWHYELKMAKDFPRWFRICSAHFKKKYLLSKLNQENTKRKVVILSTAAFPTENLPKSIEIRPPKDRRTLIHHINLEENYENEININEEIVIENRHSDMGKKILFTSLWNTEEKLIIMTGIPSFGLLERLTKICEEIYENKNLMSMRDKILMTMYKLKSNTSFSELAISFQSTFYTVNTYFTETIQVLSKVLDDIIYWQTQEQNKKRLPKSFENYSNVMTVLDCIEINTATFSCLECKTATYSHYKGQHPVKVLIGVSPSGLVNYINHAVTDIASDKAIFNFMDLMEKLKPGDAVMVDKGFLIEKELAKAGVQLVKPDIASTPSNKTKITRGENISSAREHVERRIDRMKIFKILTDKIDDNVLPYIDDILIVIGAISNLSKPILSDDKFIS